MCPGMSGYGCLEMSCLAEIMCSHIHILLSVRQKAQKSGSSTSSGAGESDQNVRKVLARQHAKDISEYTKQIHAKDRELIEIRKKVAKVWIVYKYRIEGNIREVKFLWFL